ncbi:MAG: SDR family NAD(P)-dependent oxidoreductase, partial [Planctomycetota bacterium]|nr:SDR family NAD(P)-dependent oxidoreductase [Planctomycetota bacterium]
NAHAVLGSADRAAATDPSDEGPVALPLSAATPDALQQLARLWAERAKQPGADLHKLAATAQGRTRLAERAVVLTDSLEQLRLALPQVEPGTVVGNTTHAGLAKYAQDFVEAPRAPKPLVASPGERGPYYPFQHRKFWYGPRGLVRPLQFLTEHLIPVAEGPLAETEPGVWALHGDVPPNIREALEARGLTLGHADDQSHGHLWSWTLPDAAATATATVEEAVQSLLACAAKAAAARPTQALSILLVGNHPTERSDLPVAYAIRAAVRALATEQPALQPRFVLATPDAAPELCASALLDPGPELEWHVTATERNKVRFQKRLAPSETPRFRQDRSYLVTGGTGALGQAVANWLLQHGAGKVLVASRSAAIPRQPDSTADTLSQPEVLRLQLDVGDRQQVHAAIADLRKDPMPLDGIFHFAGVLEDSLLADLDAARISRQLHAKLGALHLHEATLDLPLRHFVCASSAVTWLGNAGQSAYAAANGALDGLCRQRRALGLAGLALAFGPWAESGMAATAAVQRRLASHGIRPLPPAAALAALGSAMAYAESAVAIVDVDWAQLAETGAVAGATRLEELLGDTPPAQTSTKARQAELLALPADERLTQLHDRIVHHLAQVLGQSNEQLADDLPPTAQGLDSLLAVDLRYRLGAELGIDLPMTAILTAEDVRGLARICLALLSPDQHSPAQAQQADREFVESLTDEQVRALLRERSAGDGATR